MEELYGARVAAVFTTDADLETRPGRAPVHNTLFDERTNTLSIDRLERIVSEDTLVDVVREEAGFRVVAAQAKRRLRKIVSTEGEKLGICGEHGGDPRSIAFFHQAGLDYVSCSPFRVPIARLAAAHATLANGARDGDK